ncbi:Heat shock protein [Tubulinosema ratisbonensis]|uniref:Heat shock protein n=1 Tax=Tubulinosema ratisbonensis TaxID=291195 RepID=A0A437AK96_9MICR|nr:Heat shock protein [Tubulinosema ratisbonensis]
MLEKDYFSILNLPKKYDVCKTNLDKNYITLSKTTKDPALLNEAYTTLKDDYKRANLFLDLNKKNGDKISADFLNYIIDLEEKIEKSDFDSLKFYKNLLENKIKECKTNYNDKSFLKKWKYFLRLEKFVEEKMEEYE